MSFNPAVDSENPALAFPQHECGLFAVFGHKNAAVLTYYGLFALQHRGQESAGIVTGTGPGKTFLQHKGMGLVSQVFGQEELSKLTGTRALGHTRYSTTGTSTLKNAQPFVVDCVRGQMAIAHNGNLIKRLRTARSSSISWPGRRITAAASSPLCAESKERSLLL